MDLEVFSAAHGSEYAPKQQCSVVIHLSLKLTYKLCLHITNPSFCGSQKMLVI